jgi:hypothetical protein
VAPVTGWLPVEPVVAAAAGLLELPPTGVFMDGSCRWRSKSLKNADAYGNILTAA